MRKYLSDADRGIVNGVAPLNANKKIDEICCNCGILIATYDCISIFTKSTNDVFLYWRKFNWKFSIFNGFSRMGICSRTLSAYFCHFNS